MLSNAKAANTGMDFEINLGNQILFDQDSATADALQFQSAAGDSSNRAHVLGNDSMRCGQQSVNRQRPMKHHGASPIWTPRSSVD